MRICRNCERPFIPATANQVHCIKSCRMEYKNRTRNQGLRKCQVRGCDNEFERAQGRRFCDECRPYSLSTAQLIKKRLPVMDPEDRSRAHRTLNCLRTGEAFA